MWTSGRLCDFDGCEKSEHVKPIHVKGWFWSANNRKMSPTNCVNGERNCFHRYDISKLRLARKKVFIKFFKLKYPKIVQQSKKYQSK